MTDTICQTTSGLMPYCCPEHTPPEEPPIEYEHICCGSGDDLGAVPNAVRVIILSAPCNALGTTCCEAEFDLELIQLAPPEDPCCAVYQAGGTTNPGLLDRFGNVICNNCFQFPNPAQSLLKSLNLTFCCCDEGASNAKLALWTRENDGSACYAVSIGCSGACDDVDVICDCITNEPACPIRYNGVCYDLGETDPDWLNLDITLDKFTAGTTFGNCRPAFAPCCLGVADPTHDPEIRIISLPDVP